jgi:coenzyme F420-reducing hydrogenase delta subunit
MTQLKELQAEAVPYTVVDDAVAAGRKKIVRIVYRRCAAWQQVATLLKAFNEQKQSETFTTIIVQGMVEQDKTTYAFTNGQLQFDRGVRLGSQTLNRYQIETGSGFESDSVRILLEEK